MKRILVLLSVLSTILLSCADNKASYNHSDGKLYLSKKNIKASGTDSKGDLFFVDVKGKLFKPKKGDILVEKNNSYYIIKKESAYNN